MPSLARALCLASSLLVACGDPEHLVGRLTRLDAAADVRPDVTADTATDATGFCAPPDGGASCRGPLVATAFRYALCVCGDQALSGRLVTDAFDSARGPYQRPGELVGAVGVNGAFNSAGSLTVGGALWVGGSAGLAALDLLDVRGTTRVNGPLMGAADATLVDASFRGDVWARNLRARTLTLPADRGVHVTDAMAIGTVERRDVPVAAPCDCSAAARVPVAALVAERRGDHDDARVGLTPDGLTRDDRPPRLTLPCGRYYFQGIGGRGDLQLLITGRVAVYVEGTLLLDGNLRVTLAPGAELDLFLTGDVNLPRGFVFGDATTPTRARMYVGGSGSMALGGDGVFAGNLHAPGVELQVAGDLEVFGALVARRVAASGNLTVHFDRAVLEPASGCAVPDGTRCATCRDCPTAACIDSRCAPCQRDDDCCAPLRCAAGRCVATPP